MQAPQPTYTATLPSPSSLNCPNPRSLPSISPPTTTSIQTSTQSALLQDLQHQVSVKTLEFRTLQREYDNLLQKLEQQTTKCTTLEKKFEISDAEINSLTDEKEKLQVQVAAMVTQVEELQQSRGEARRQLVANGAQYMRIVDMANRLQAQGAEDKKKWEAERSGLKQRIRVLEEAVVTGGAEDSTPSTDREYRSSGSLVSVPGSVASPSSQAELIHVLRAEVGRLRSRTLVFETALQDMHKESVSIQTTARRLMESGGRLEAVAQSTVGSGG
jgi:DNA repair exonuclease SbcCD ATPase subunit